MLLSADSDPEGGLILPEFAVSDLLTQGYTLLPPIPEGVLASVLVQVEDRNIDYFNAMFDPSGGYEEDQFGVLCWMRSPTKLAVFFYSSVSCSWTHAASIGLDTLDSDLARLVQGYAAFLLPDYLPSYANGCLYWKLVINKILNLNINSMEFSVISLPYDYEDENVVEITEGKIGMFSLNHSPEQPQCLCYSIKQNERESANEHPKDTIVTLPDEYDHYCIDRATEGYVFLTGFPSDETLMSTCFSLEIKTMKLERVWLSKFAPHYVVPYFGFPPFMSPRRI